MQLEAKMVIFVLFVLVPGTFINNLWMTYEGPYVQYQLMVHKLMSTTISPAATYFLRLNVSL